MVKKEKIKCNTGAIITEPGSTEKNKTGSWRSLKPVIDIDKCIKCGRCWQFCSSVAIKMTKHGPIIDYDYCKGCGICAIECPAKAITMEKEEK